MSCVSVAISPQYVLPIIVNSIQGALCSSRVKDSESRCWSTRSVILLCERRASQGRGDPGRTFPKVVTVGHVVHCGLANILPFEAF